MQTAHVRAVRSIVTGFAAHTVVVRFDRMRHKRMCALLSADCRRRLFRKFDRKEPLPAVLIAQDLASSKAGFQCNCRVRLSVGAETRCRTMGGTRKTRAQSLLFVKTSVFRHSNALCLTWNNTFCSATKAITIGCRGSCFGYCGGLVRYCNAVDVLAWTDIVLLRESRLRRRAKRLPTMLCCLTRVCIGVTIEQSALSALSILNNACVYRRGSCVLFGVVSDQGFGVAARLARETTLVCDRGVVCLFGHRPRRYFLFPDSISFPA